MKDTTRIVQIMASKSILIVILLISIAIVYYGRRLDANAQETKGGSRFSSSSDSSFNSIKGGGFSRFKENILSIQQQQLAKPVQIVKENVESISSSSFLQQPVENSVSSFKSSIIKETNTQQQTSDAEPTIYGSVEGVPGVDFPGFTSIPNTPFTCEGRPFDPGMYADESTGCQVYHLCYLGRRESFLCGIGTVFNQAILNCDFWHSVECSKSSEYYHLNADFGKASAEGGTSGGSSFSSKQELSSTFNRVPVPTVGKTSFKSEQFSSALQVNPLPVVSTSQFKRIQSVTSKISPPKTALQTAFSVKGASSSSSGSAGFLSPGRQVQLTRLSGLGADVDSGQLAASASSNRFKVSSGKTSVSVSSAGLTVTGATESQAAKTSADQRQAPTSNEVPSDEWKPYFKNKANVGSTTSSNASAPASGGTVDQEPVFSAQQESNQNKQSEQVAPAANELPKVPKSGSPPVTTSGTAVTSTEAESATAPSVGVEADVGAALAAATTPPAPAVSSTADEPKPTGAPDASTSSSVAPTTSEGTDVEAPSDGSSVEYASATTTTAPSSADETANRRRKKKKKKKRNERDAS